MPDDFSAPSVPPSPPGDALRHYGDAASPRSRTQADLPPRRPYASRVTLPRVLLQPREQATQLPDVVRTRRKLVGVHLDQPAHSCRLVDEDGTACPRNHFPESVDRARISGHGIPVRRLEQADNVEAITPPLLGALVPAVEPSVQLAGDQRQATGHGDRDLEILTPHPDVGRQPCGRPVRGDEKPVLVVEVGGGSRVENLDDLELDALYDSSMLTVAGRDERVMRALGRRGIDVERRAMALAEVTPDREAADDRPRPCRVSNLAKSLDERTVHRWQHELLHCHTTSAADAGGSMELHSPRISRPRAEVDRSSAATTGCTTPSTADAITSGVGAMATWTADPAVS